MAQNLLTPILNDRTRSVNFFNGRLLTGEDLTAEQKANRVAHSLLGQSIGSGVAYGLEVSESALSSTVVAPVLKVTQGLAVNRNGTVLLLDQDTEIALTRPAPGPSTTTKVFDDCDPIQSGVYVAGAAVYLLTVGPASATQGLAEVSGVSTGTAPCNSRYKAEGVQFRRIQLDLSLGELSDVNHLRNLVAYKFFGVADWASVVTDPFGQPPATFGLMDQLRSQQLISDCEVPLAVFYWTASGGLGFVDMWAVRRPIIQQDASTLWMELAGKRRTAEGLAMFLQFQKQVDDLQSSLTQGQRASTHATDYFASLPPVGILPVAEGSSSAGFDHTLFFPTVAYRKPVFVNGARLETILRHSLLLRPIDLNSDELIWLYRVRENRQPPLTGGANTGQAFMVFSTGHAAYYGDARYQLARRDYSNYF